MFAGVVAKPLMDNRDERTLRSQPDRLQVLRAKAARGGLKLRSEVAPV